MYFNFNNGILVKENEYTFLLRELFDPDSMKFPVKFSYINKTDSAFILEIAGTIPLHKVLIDDSITFDTVKDQYRTPTFFRIKPLPVTIQIQSPFEGSFFFNNDSSIIKSVKYTIPDSCNYMIINDIEDRGHNLGVKPLRFNKKTGELYSETEVIILKKVHRPNLKFARKFQRRNLRKEICK